METEFTPWLSLVGGILIGTASVLLMGLRGRILGATGILSGFFMPESSTDWAWRAFLLAGMFTGPVAYMLLTGSWAALDVPTPMNLLVIGGVLVGLGASLGGGCTSGHGVCGMARLSPRSIVATLTFMGFTGLTVFVIRHLMGA